MSGKCYARDGLLGPLGWEVEVVEVVVEGNEMLGDEGPKSG